MRVPISNPRERYPIVTWRPVWDLSMCYVPMAISIFVVTQISWFYYPLAVVVIANRLLALSLLCHEGLHGNLARNKFWNDWVGRWLCAFPSMISFSKYRKLHHLHHWAVGSERWDPDRSLYDLYPVSPRGYVWGTILNAITLRTSLRFAAYYVLPESLKPRRFWALVRASDSDFFAFLIFHVLLLATVIHLGQWLNYELLYVVPVLFVLQPYVVMMGGLQHGPVQPGRQPELISRTIRGPKWLMEMLLPCDINFHAEHHMNPAIPHYRLRQFSRDLETMAIPTWHNTYLESLQNLFETSR